MLNVYNPGGELSEGEAVKAFEVLPAFATRYSATLPSAASMFTVQSGSPATHTLTMKTWLMLTGASVLAYWFLFRKKKI